jgi:hypothetical protein
VVDVVFTTTVGVVVVVVVTVGVVAGLIKDETALETVETALEIVLLTVETALDAKLCRLFQAELTEEPMFDKAVPMLLTALCAPPTIEFQTPLRPDDKP